MRENALIRQTLALTVRELKHWYRSKMQIFMALIQPIIWLGLFGTMMTGMMEGMSMGLISSEDYFNFLALGIVVMTALTTAMSSGMSLIWDRRFGFLDKIRAAPIPRGIIPLSRVLATTVKALVQSLIVFIIAFAMGLNVTAFTAWSIPAAILVIVGVSLAFSTIFVTLGLVVKKQEVFMGLNMLLMMPLMFVSGVMFPLSNLTGTGIIITILRAIANVNPLTFAADAMRLAFLESNSMLSLDFSMGTDLLILIVVAVAITVVGMIASRRALVSK